MPASGGVLYGFGNHLGRDVFIGNQRQSGRGRSAPELLELARTELQTHPAGVSVQFMDVGRHIEIVGKKAARALGQLGVLVGIEGVPEAEGSFDRDGLVRLAAQSTQTVEVFNQLLFAHRLAVEGRPPQGLVLTAVELDHVAQHLLGLPALGVPGPLVLQPGNVGQQALGQLVARVGLGRTLRLLALLGRSGSGWQPGNARLALPLPQPFGQLPG